MDWMYRIVSAILAVEIFLDLGGLILLGPWQLPADMLTTLLTVVFALSAVWNAGETLAVMTLNIGQVTATGPRRYRAIFWSTFGTLMVLTGLVLIAVPLRIPYAIFAWVLRVLLALMLLADVIVAVHALRGE